jgi:signal transduction histidine kinase
MAKLKILVVDDEPGIRSGVSRILQNFRVSYPFMDEDFEYIITEASTGEEAVEIIDRELPDIILLDNKLPGIQGIEVLEYIKNKQYDVIVVMITSFASIDLAVKATRDGAYDFIPKPFAPQELRSSIENITRQLYLTRMTSQMKEEGKQTRYQFLSIMSHELKAPLNAIESYLRIMKDKEMGNAVSDYSEIIDRSIYRVKGMRNLIMDLLDFTKIKSSASTAGKTDVNLCEVAQVSIDSMRPYAIQKDIDVYLNAQYPVSMNANPGDIEIIFNNLISNAIKYNKDGGRVDCNISKEADIIVISVTDTGIGIDEEDIPKLFSEFVRIKNEETKNISGTGLGLSIVKGIVDIYGGNIDVESTPGKGSTFILHIPAK